MIVRMAGLGPDGKPFEKTIPYHKCTEEEYAEFYPLVSHRERQFQLHEVAGGFNCIDWDNDNPYLVFGDSTNDDVWQNLNILLVTCDYIGQFGYHTVPEECNTSLQEQKDYIGKDLNLSILHN